MYISVATASFTTLEHHLAHFNVRFIGGHATLSPTLIPSDFFVPCLDGVLIISGFACNREGSQDYVEEA